MSRCDGHRVRWTILALLAAALPLGAQDEVPAILGVYRANPTQAAAFDGGGAGANSTISLTARQVRQLFYESNVIGYQQGEPETNGLYGTDADGNGYVTLTEQRSPADRLPAMPLAVRDATGDLHLYLAIWKLPTQQACQNVVNTMMTNDWLPGDATNGIDAAEDAIATGRWRVLVHLPRGRGAPPAPSLYYPEAARITGAATAAQQRRFWDGFLLRYRDWHKWVSDLWADTAGAIAADTAPTAATAASGQEPVPFFLQYPEYLDTAESTGYMRNLATGYAAYNTGSYPENEFFNAQAVYENRRLDPDREAAFNAASEPRAPYAIGQAELSEDARTTDPLWQSEGNQPLEFYLNAFANGSDGGTDFASYTPTLWWLRGVNTVGKDETAAGQTVADTNTAGATQTLVGSGSLFGTLKDGGGAYVPLVLDINLTDAAGLTTIPPGIGSVELQFEYETYVPEADTIDTDWDPDPWGPDHLRLNVDDLIDDPRGPDGQGNNGTGDDIPLQKGTDRVFPSYGVNAPGGGAGNAKDPLNPTAQDDPDVTTDGQWRVRRYSGWPFASGTAGVTPAGTWQGGPIVCRYVVSPIAVVPEDQNTASAEESALVDVARYDATQGYRYPQLAVFNTGNAALDAQLMRACFLLGYRGDIDTAGDTRTNTDYFFPLQPGTRSESHPVFVSVTNDDRPSGEVHLWTDADAITDAASAYKTTNSGYPLAGPLDAGFEPTETGVYIPRYNSFTTIADADLPTQDYRKLLTYDLQTVKKASGDTAGIRPDTAVRYQDGALTGTVANAFDGNSAADADDPVVPDGYSAGLIFGAPTRLDRVDVYWTGGAGTAADWTLQWSVEQDDDQNLLWTDSGLTLQMLGGHGVATVPVTASPLLGFRVKATGADLTLQELRLGTRADVRDEAVTAASAPNYVAPDKPNADSIGTANAQVKSLPDRELATSANTVLRTSLQVAVPTFQPPSRDAVGRHASGTSYLTQSRPVRDTGQAAGSQSWDRYRGSGRLYLDDTRARAWTPGGTADAIAALTARHWDARLYQRAASAGLRYQFVSWYDEDTGTVGAITTGGKSYASLNLPVTGQRVSVEPYATFDYELSVAYDRRLSVMEPLIDFGKVLHGGISQWVPITLSNEGNVPLTDISLYFERLTPVTAADRENYVRQRQQSQVLEWIVESRGFPGALAVAPAGSAQGTQLSTGMIRVGTLDRSDPLNRAADRRVPVGQPLGNYTGDLTFYPDGLGAVADEPDAEEIAIGGTVAMKLTVQESPLWRILDFWDNDVDRRDRADAVNALEPYDPGSNTGTFQPVPEFDQYYSHPDYADTTPGLLVVQDPAQFTDSPPNTGDILWLTWSSLRQLTSGVNWGVYHKSASRISVTGASLETEYRSFTWPDGAAARLSADQGGERNLYPNACIVDPVSGSDREYLLLWHNEQTGTANRPSYLRFIRYQGSNDSGILQIPDDASGSARVNKQVPRAFVHQVTGASSTPNVLWVAWQTGESGQTRLGFNAIQMPDAYNGAASSYIDAVRGTGGSFVNYELRTPPGLTNVMEPYVLPGYRNEVTSAGPVSNQLRTLNLFYSAWSPLWQNQDVYWSRYRPIEDGAYLPSGSQTRLDGLRRSPMAENAWRLASTTVTVAGNDVTYFSVRSLPGGRIPFPRVTNELLRTNANHTVYAAAQIDWVMPSDHFYRSYNDNGTWKVERFNHRGFADADRPLYDPDTTTYEPLVSLRVYAPTALFGQPLTGSAIASGSTAVTFDLDGATWDPANEEWILPITGPAVLTARGVTVARIHPGLGRVAFNKPLYRRGSTTPVYVYATYRPCAWRITTDRAADTQPVAAFDWWERLAIVWRRTVEGGQGQLWYRTFSLAVPLPVAPVRQLRAVANGADLVGDANLDGDSSAPLTYWSFTGSADIGGSGDGLTQAAPGAWSNYATTFDNLTLSTIANGSYASSTQSSAQTGQNAAGMVHFAYNDAGRTVWIFYESPAETGVIQRVATRVPGLGPERLVPIDGAVNESQPAIAPEHMYVRYELNSTTERIMSSRFWLAWVSTRDLYLQEATASRPGTAGTNVFYGTFLPDFAPSTEN